jgi:hypothetical protein
MEKETLEEAAEKLFPTCTTPLRKIGQKGFIAGAEWQAERMYTEEDMKKAMLNVIEFTEFQKNEFRKNNDYHMALDIIQAIKQETLEQ